MTAAQRSGSGAAAGQGNRHDNYRLTSGRVHTLSGASRCRLEPVLARPKVTPGSEQNSYTLPVNNGEKSAVARTGYFSFQLRNMNKKPASML